MNFTSFLEYYTSTTTSSIKKGLSYAQVIAVLVGGGLGGFLLIAFVITSLWYRRNVLYRENIKPVDAVKDTAIVNNPIAYPTSKGGKNPSTGVTMDEVYLHHDDEL